MTTTDSQYDPTVDARPDSHRPATQIDAAFDALATRGCRALLGHLAGADELAVEELTARLIAEAAESDTEAVESDTEATESSTATDVPGVEECVEAGADGDADGRDAAENRVRAHLHHVLLPKLDDADLVDYDDDSGHATSQADSRFAALTSAVEEYEATESPVPLDVAFDLLADHRRRTAYQTLLTHDDLSLPDLADEVAVVERDRPLPEIDPDAVLRVYLSLYHTHVPKLASAGLVAYDQEDDYVALTEAGRAFERSARTLWDAAGT